MKTMKVKTKNRIKAAFRFLGFAILVAMIFFNLFLSIGIYGQMKFKQGHTKGFFEGLNNARKPPPTSTTLPQGDIEAISFAESTHIGDK